MTPLMKQYWDIKSLHSDKILFFRMGDFYEMFGDDARAAAPVLNIALTQRNKKSADDTAMCGFPHHAVAGPINKLLSHQFKVAICEQIEDPKKAQGIVKRAVTRILTPGMVYDPETLDESKSHFMASFDEKTVSFFDSSTGESFYFEVSSEKQKWETLHLLSPVELVLAPQQEAAGFSGAAHSVHDSLGHAEKFGFEFDGLPSSMRRLLAYAYHLAGDDLLKTLKKPLKRNIRSRMVLSESVQRHLEIFENNKGEVHPTFFSCINRALTSAGKRLLRSWVLAPLTDVEEISQRQQRLDFWRSQFGPLKMVRESLKSVGDLERRFVKLTTSQVNGRDVLSLSASLSAALAVMDEVSYLADQSSPEFPQLKSLVLEIEKTIVESPPLTIKQGHVIRKGIHVQLDEYIALSTDAHQILQDLESREKASTGISSLKIRYNNVFGYYIEVTNTHKDKVPAHYHRKQTLATCERFYTEELLELEKKILSAQTKRFELEHEVFENLRVKVLSWAASIHQLSEDVSQVDVETALSWLSLEENYVKPVFSENSELLLRSSRHVVLDQTHQTSFVPNDLIMKDHQVLLLTGPNMAGKSTLMRQVGLIAILAQMGSFVPAASAEMPIFDQIHTRIGASDQLSEGLSTFMVEMTETAELLKNATSKSLVILDEIGRGTATFDGMSLAEAILEYLLVNVKCFTFFATHYHELAKMDERFLNLRNAHMSVRENRGNLEFHYLLAKGPALKSYGIAVAKLAGLPLDVIRTAQKTLTSLERKAAEALGSNQVSLMDWTLDQPGVSGAGDEAAVVVAENSAAVLAVLEKLREFDLNRQTPLEAMGFLADLQAQLKDAEMG